MSIFSGMCKDPFSFLDYFSSAGLGIELARLLYIIGVEN